MEELLINLMSKSFKELFEMLLRLIVILIGGGLVGTAVYYGRKLFIMEQLKPYMSKIVEIALKVEAKCPHGNGGIKKERVIEEVLSELDEDAIKCIKKSFFGDVGNFVQYVFVTIVQPTILSKLRGGVVVSPSSFSANELAKESRKTGENK